ncbi:MAG TPA: tetratricopeptide repeat protein [Anaeromyxobacter sp.]|nr:tetratricopeptide repeat protein [Anaeromyxobacter sp.]
MGFLSRRPKTRSELVAEADRARARGRVRKAVAGYRKALESDPSDPSLNVKLAPLLARIGDAEGGARCFRAAAKKHLDAGFTDRAAAVNLTATAIFPLDEGFRLELSRLNVLRGRRQDALQTLIEGGKVLARARRPDAAASLLGRALEIEPWHLDTCLALVPVLARNGAGKSAHKLVEGLLQRYRGPARKRIRWAAFRAWPGAGTFWRWLRA